LGATPMFASAQTVYTENFTGTTTQNSWYFANGACLTAGTAGTTSAASPACVGLPYYIGKGDTLIGGDTGSLPDLTSGALRFTNWFGENGAILSNFTFPLTGSGAQGLQVSFTTVTYEGNSGGGGHDGADGISFFLQDSSYTPMWARSAAAWGTPAPTPITTARCAPPAYREVTTVCPAVSSAWASMSSATS